MAFSIWICSIGPTQEKKSGCLLLSATLFEAYWGKGGSSRCQRSKTWSASAELLRVGKRQCGALIKLPQIPLEPNGPQKQLACDKQYACGVEPMSAVDAFCQQSHTV